jgi:phage terminase large subunit GpA-like protein
VKLVFVRDRRGYTSREWRTPRGQDEAFDSYVYAPAAAMVDLDRRSEARWLELEELMGRPSPLAGPHGVVRGECWCMTGRGAMAGVGEVNLDGPVIRAARAGMTTSGAAAR